MEWVCFILQMGEIVNVKVVERGFLKCVIVKNQVLYCYGNLLRVGFDTIDKK